MAIEVIVRGEVHSKTYRAWCQNCRSQLQFKAEDAVYRHDPRGDSALKIDCPVCTASVWVQP